MRDEPTTSESAMDAQLDELVNDATLEPARPGFQAPRDALDAQESLIQDAVLRMGTLVEDAIRKASRSLQTHDAVLALEVIKGDTIVATIVEPGAVLGEMSVLLDTPHTATVRAAQDSAIYEIDDAASFLRQQPVVSLMIARMLAKRLAPATVETADEAGFSADALEAQAFAFLAVRSMRGLPITFPTTSGAPKPMQGGVMVKP